MIRILFLNLQINKKKNFEISTSSSKINKKKETNLMVFANAVDI